MVPWVISAYNTAAQKKAKEENEKDFLSDENKKEIINSVLMRETLINYFFKIFPLEKLCFS